MYWANEESDLWVLGDNGTAMYRFNEDLYKWKYYYIENYSEITNDSEIVLKTLTKNSQIIVTQDDLPNKILEQISKHNNW
ncbi:hypothetical protein LJC58_06340 [Lachnospiraceae bacterium OttesenSCG-928-D06]|nr:hypothetical protein [Lachnospiraceae bacterium OttesenSCG-928-D06]